MQPYQAAAFDVPFGKNTADSKTPVEAPPRIENDLKDLPASRAMMSKVSKDSTSWGVEGKPIRGRGGDNIYDVKMPEVTKYTSNTEAKDIPKSATGYGPPSVEKNPRLLAEEVPETDNLNSAAGLLIGLFMGSGATLAVWFFRRGAFTAREEPLLGYSALTV